MKNLRNIVLFCFLMCGCSAPYFDHPLAALSKDFQDKQLSGNWLYVEDGNFEKASYVHIGFDEDLKTTRIILTGVEDGNIGMMEFKAYSHNFENQKYISFQEINTDSKNERFVIAQYEIKGRKLIVRFMDDKLFSKAVKSGKIKGDVFEGQFGTTVTITDSQERTRKFILNNRDKIFIEIIKATRIDAEQVAGGDAQKRAPQR